MAERLYTNISNLFTKKQKLYELMCASSVFGMGLGKKKAEALCKGVDNNFNNLKVEDINKLDGFSTKTSEKIVENLPKFVEFLDRMKKFGIEIEEKEIDKEIDKEIEIKKDINDYYINEYVVFSGFRDKKMEEEIKNGGGFIQSSINKKTTLLIIKKGCESSKVEKAKEMGIKLLIKN
jgi:NAD-dependent DNA ligase